MAAEPPGTKIIGRISVKVLPDTSEFRHEAERKLDAIEKQLKLEVKLDLKFSKAALQASAEAVEKQLEKAIQPVVEISVEADKDSVNDLVGGLNKHVGEQLELNFDGKVTEEQLELDFEADLDQASIQQVEKQLEEWQEDISPLEVEVDPDLVPGQTQSISARLAWLTRSRIVHIIPVLSTSAMGGVMSALNALSGGRVLKDMMTNVWDALKNLDKSVPKIGLIASAIGGLSSLALTGISNISALTLSLAQMVTAGLAAPGLFAGMAIGLGVLVTAMARVKDFAPEVIESFKGISDIIGKNFWKEATEGVKSLLDVHLPRLGETATEMGRLVGGLAGQLAGPFKDAIPGMFENLNGSLKILTNSTETFASIITVLGQAGSEYLPRMAKWVTNLSDQFNSFLTSARADGSLQDFIDTGIEGIKDLGTVLLNAAKIIGDIGKAAQAGGGSTLGILADTMERIHAVTSSPEFQSTLTSVFRTAHQVIGTITDIAGPAVTKLLKALAETFNVIGPALGEGLGVAIGAIAGALADPRLQKGVQSIFFALRDAIVTLAPVLPNVAGALAALSGVVVELLGVIAPLIATALVPLSEIIEILAPVIGQLVEVLGAGLIMVLEAVAPILVLVAEELADMVVALVPVISVLVTVLGQELAAALAVVAPLLPDLVKSFGDLLIAVLPIITQLLPSLSLALQKLVPELIRLMQVFTNVVVAIMPLVEKALPMVIAGLNTVFRVATAVVNGVYTILASLFRGIIDSWTAFARIFTGGWENLWTNVKNFFKTMWNSARDLLGAVLMSILRLLGSFAIEAWNVLVRAGKSLMSGFVEGIRSKINDVKQTLRNLTGNITSWKGPEATDRVLLFDAGQLVIGGFIAGLESQYDAVKRSLRGLSRDIGGFDMAAPGVGAMVTNSIGTAGNAGGYPTKVLNYYAAPGSGFSSEEDLFQAAERARMVF